MVTWQSETLWAEAEMQKDLTATPLVFESIETVDCDSTNAHGLEAEREQAASALERSLKRQEELHASDKEECVRRAQVEEHNRCEEEFGSAILRERETVIRACRQFGDERQRYFDQVEGEIVKLSLAIAARILHREVKLDPLLLAGVVQVALEQIQEGSDVVLRVPTVDVDAWSRRVEGLPKHLAVNIVGDDRLEAGDCTLETNIGSVSLGIEAQLREIEQGFFDLLKRRPA